MSDGPALVVTGGGSVAVATDAVLADAQRLHALSLSLPVVAIGIRYAARGTGPVESRALGSWRLREADSAIDLALTRLHAVSLDCDRIAIALDAAALAYGEAERAATARFIHFLEKVAAVGGAFVGDTVDRTPELARLLAMLSATHIHEALGEAIAPGDVQLPSELNALLSDPRVVELLRSMLMAADDFAGGIVAIPESVAQSTSDVGIGALMLLALGSLGGLFASTPVTTSAFGGATTVRAATTVADRADRVPDAVAGDVPQVRIDTYSEPGRPDRFEVYIGGTVDFGPVAAGEPFDLTANLKLMAGLPAGSYDGVVQAMAMAGVTAESPVVFTGHSQGALIAASLVASGQYAVEGLLTFGGPIGQIRIPPAVPTLIVEHSDDVVTALGGRQDNLDAVIVRPRAYSGVDDLPPHALPSHRIEAYIDTASAIDTEARSGMLVTIRDQLCSFTDGFSEASSQSYLVARAP